MHEYDVALKRILTRPNSTLLAALTGEHSLRWLNVEAPEISNRRVDLLGESREGSLTHIELQSRNEKDFPLRMAEYLFGIMRRYGRTPQQIVLYVGGARLRMPDRIEGPNLLVRYHLVDARDLDGEGLLASDNVGDNVMAILTSLGSQPETVRRMLHRIAAEPAGDREQALAELLIVAGLRKMDEEVEREANGMPILNDIMDHAVLGRAIRQGRLEGELALLRRQIEKKFGEIPLRINEKLDTLKPVQLETAALRLLDAQELDDIFAR